MDKLILFFRKLLLNEFASDAVATVKGIASGIQGAENSGGNIISFDINRNYGVDAVLTGNITFDLANFTSGITQLLIHNAGSEPTFPSSVVTISGTYTTSVNNYIFLTAVSPTLILRTISQAQ
jgi:hypothetical protein